VWQKRPVRHHWPTSRTRCSSALNLLADQHLVPVARLPSFSTLRVRVGRLTSFSLTCVRTCGRNAVLGITGLQLVPVARLPSFSSLAYISYTLLVCRHSPHWPSTGCGCSSASFFLLATAPTRCSFDLISADLRSNVAETLCYASLAYYSGRTSICFRVGDGIESRKEFRGHLWWPRLEGPLEGGSNSSSLVTSMCLLLNNQFPPSPPGAN